MSRVVESPAHRQVRATLTNLARKVNSLQVDEFDLQQLKNLNIHVDPITLDETSPNKPSYFASYPGHSVPEPNNDDLGGAYNGLDDETEHSLTRPADRAYVMDMYLSSYISYYDLNAKGERAPWTSKCVGDSAFVNSGLYKHDQPEFGCYHIAELDEPAYPHVKAVMYNNLVATDSTILGGELIPILRIMLTQLRRPKFIHQIVSPVLIFSLMGLQARVIEAFFQDHKLVLRPTKMQAYWDTHQGLLIPTLLSKRFVIYGRLNCVLIIVVNWSWLIIWFASSFLLFDSELRYIQHMWRHVGAFAMRPNPSQFLWRLRSFMTVVQVHFVTKCYLPSLDMACFYKKQDSRSCMQGYWTSIDSSSSLSVSDSDQSTRLPNCLIRLAGMPCFSYTFLSCRSTFNCTSSRSCSTCSSFSMSSHSLS